jgi:hypothetical protein
MTDDGDSNAALGKACAARARDSMLATEESFVTDCNFCDASRKRSEYRVSPHTVRQTICLEIPRKTLQTGRKGRISMQGWLRKNNPKKSKTDAHERFTVNAD